MKNSGILVILALMFTACQTSYVSNSAYDDVYYTPKSASGNAATLSDGKSESGLNYGNNAEGERFTQTSDPEVKYVESQDNSNVNSSASSTEALPAPSGDSSDEYYYIEDGSDDYYDYDYASRINRFNGSCYDCGYYSPIYTGIGYSPYSGFGMSMGYGWGMPYSGFSMNFGWGMGYPYYYDPFYYDPWYSWYSPYSYYGGSYWAGYNNGFWNGYYAGGGGYYPSGDDYTSGSYYGPRNSRSGSLISPGSDNRQSRVGGLDEQGMNPTGNSSGRESRIGGGDVIGGTSATKTTTQNARDSRNIQANEITTISGGVSGDIKSEKLNRPGDGSNVTPNPKNQQEISTRNERTNGEIEAQKISKPASISQEGNNVQRNVRSQENLTGGTKYAKPAANSNETGVTSRTKKYAKPATTEVQRNTQPKNYSSPNYNKPRSSNEYTVPDSRNTRSNIQPEKTNTRNSNTQAQPEKSRSYYTPSKSNNSFSTPARTNGNNISPSKQGSGSSTPARSGSSYSAPTRSGGGSSTPARSGGSSVSPSGGSSRSSGSSSGGSSGGSSTKSSGGGSGRR